MTAWQDAPAHRETRRHLQHMLSLLRSTVPPVHPAGLPFISAGLALAAASAAATAGCAAPGLLAAGACAGVLPSPAAGAAHPARCRRRARRRPGLPDRRRRPARRTRAGRHGPLPRISIFLSMLDAHVQRAPVSGEVVAVEHRPGRFGSADLPAASDRQRRNSVRIRTAGRRRGGRRADRRVWSRAGSSATSRRGQAVDRRHLRPDPVRLAAGHLPAAGHRACSSSSASAP